MYPQLACSEYLNAENAVISCSPIHIKKTIMNLLTNAAEAVAGAGEVVISTSNQQIDASEEVLVDMDSGNYLVIEVKDNGLGIDSKDLEHIFEPFYTKKKMGRSGTGLGLSVVWNTVQDHDGRIFVESNDKGTCFKLYFRVSREEKVVSSDKNDKDIPLGHGERILVIDDEPQLRDIAGQILASLGYTVDSVCSGELALGFLADNRVDLLVIDMLMEPGMNGRESYERILELHPGQKAIIASGFSESDEVKATLKLGAGGFIKKPYSMEEFARAVRDALAT